jgi:[ribosomal protein S5]-alanine N-acetyltransferase
LKLETKRLVLREWSKKDVDDLIEGLNNLDISRWMAYVQYPYTKKDAINWINFCTRDENGDSYHFAIELQSERKVIGGIDLRINKSQGAAGGGLWINANYHRQGYATEALTARINFGFYKLGLRRFENGYFRGNIPSARLQNKLGYKVEGLRKEAYVSKADGQVKDEYITALLRKDWVKNE